MPRPARPYLLLVSLVAAPAPGLAAAPQTGLPSTAAAAASRASGTTELELRVARLEKLLKARAVATQRLPEEVRLLGQQIPLNLSDVRERMEREFVVALADEASLVLWQKRAGAAFPVIEAALRRSKLPEDLKYVAVIESGLRSHAKSWAGAVGPWQFMPATGRESGLTVAEAVDERRDLERSTEAALKFLSSLYRRFDDWFLALAAYNCGPARVARALERQGVKSYWDLVLPNEAERYVSRVAAAAIILRDAERYGVRVPDSERFDPEQTRTVQIALSQGVDLLRVARAAGTTYRHVRMLNPWLRASRLPAGRHELTVPAGTDSAFAARVAKLAPADEARAPRRTARAGKATPAKRRQPKKQADKQVRHRVRPGESLWDLAEKYGVTTAELQRRNSIRKADLIYPGQVLHVR